MVFIASSFRRRIYTYDCFDCSRFSANIPQQKDRQAVFFTGNFLVSRACDENPRFCNAKERRSGNNYSFANIKPNNYCGGMLYNRVAVECTCGFAAEQLDTVRILCRNSICGHVLRQSATQV
jgi:hypothetical protein